jgi:hypothetical protein
MSIGIRGTFRAAICRLRTMWAACSVARCSLTRKPSAATAIPQSLTSENVLFSEARMESIESTPEEAAHAWHTWLLLPVGLYWWKGKRRLTGVQLSAWLRQPPSSDPIEYCSGAAPPAVGGIYPPSRIPGYVRKRKFGTDLMWKASYVRNASDQPVLLLLGFCPLTYTLDETSEEKGKLFLTSLATNSCAVGV